MPSNALNILHALIIIGKVYSFPGVAVAKYHKLGGLKQWKFILS